MSAENVPTPPQAGWTLAFHDEFDRPGRPEPAKWTYEQGFVRNQELQLYRPENATVRDGCLVIEGRRERVVNPGADPTSDRWQHSRTHAEYTSASVTTKGTFAWLYGRLEVRARFVAERGLWPAIWTLGVDGKWPQCGEIDLFEYYQDIILANAFWGNGEAVTKRMLQSFGPGWASEWHVWSLDWDRNQMVISIDGHLINHIDIGAMKIPDGAVHPFRQPHYLLLNLAIGGKAGGDPSQATCPTRFLIDWVRIWQPPADA